MTSPDPTATGSADVEEALRRSEQLLSLSQRMAHLGSWEWTPHLEQLRWSDEVFRIFGEPVGAFTPGFDSYLTRVHPDDREMVARTIENAARQQSAYAFDHRVVHPDGQVRHVHCEGEPVAQPGQPLRLVGTIHDRTEQHEAERERAASEERLRRAQQVAGVGDWAVDLHTGRILWSEQTYRLFRRDPAGAPPARDELVAMLDAPSRERLSTIKARADEEAEFAIELGVTLPDGEKVTYEATVCSDPAQRARTLYGVVRDVTALRQAEKERDSLLAQTRASLEEAQQATRAKDLFLAVLSHELRTPMTTILTWTQLLRRGWQPPEKQQLALSRIERAALIQKQLINDLLDVSRIESGKLELAPVLLSAAEGLYGAVEQVLPDAKARSIDIVVEGEVADATLYADPVRLQQVLVNLLGNALKFSPEGGHVTVRLGRVEPDEANPHPRARFTVADNGRGISADFLPSVFDPFSQADSSASRQHGGLGLGLSIVKRLVDSQGGRVFVHSDGEGLGARFEVELPVVDLPLPASVLVEPTRLDGIRILLVDDDELTARSLEAAFDDAGAQVQLASSARAALEALETGALPHVLVCDIGMPGETGYWLLRHLRALPGPEARLPALALTAFATESDRAEAFDSGFDAHLSKPVDLATLLSAVAALAPTEAPAPTASP